MAACLFCRIAQKEVPAAVVYEDDRVLAFKDIDPRAPVHVLIIPKKHVARVSEVPAGDLGLFADIHKAAQDIAARQGVKDAGFRLVVNNGADAGQAVDHLHYHLLGGRRLTWPPG
jgi:histidine triad (HIT) family protein